MQNNVTTLDHSVLRRIRNLALFSDNQLNNLAARLESKFAAPKQRIIGLGDMGEYSLYLLSGESISSDSEGNESKVSPESDDNLQPIAHIRPSLYEIEALSPANYLEIPNDLLTELSLIEEPDSAEMEVEIIEQTKVVRLGMDVIRKQIMIYAASELFQSKSTSMKNRMRSLWKNCRKVSAFSRVLANESGRFDPEIAQIAGLLSELGIIAILDYAQSHSDLYVDDDDLDQTIRALHPQINGMLLYHWNLGDEIVTVGEESRNWFRNHRDDADLCDLVMVARYYSLLGTPAEKTLPALSKIPAFLKLQLEFSVGESSSFIKESRAEVAAVESMLGSA